MQDDTQAKQEAIISLQEQVAQHNNDYKKLEIRR